MANSENVKVFRYYEGLCSSEDFPKELAKVLSLGVQSDKITDSDGVVLSEPVPLKDKNWDIIYPAPDASFVTDKESMSWETYKNKILNQVDKITDTVILKTRTTEKTESGLESDEFSVDSDSTLAYKEMYLEIYKPEYIANPEEYPLDCERKGLTPKLITKELYQNKFEDHIAIEEILNDTFDSSRVNTPVIKEEQTSLGTSVDVSNLTYEELDEYFVALQSVTGDLSLKMPNNNIMGDEVVKDIDTAMLSKIKQESNFLYSFIISSFNGAEEYNQFQKLSITFITIDTNGSGLFQITMKPTLKTTNYTIKKGTVFNLKFDPIDEVYPELYIDGIYIPIDSKYYTYTHNSASDVRKITFDENFEYEKSKDGVLTVRYEYKIDTTNNLITSRVEIKNNHYLLMRLYDNINAEGTGPAENVYNSAGDVVQTNVHVSPWSKLSWYRDFEEILLDTIDADVPINNISDGTVLVPLETTGLTSDTKLQYWINTNNDRFSLIVMGNPSLDLEKDRHLISSCYCGAIDSFDNSILDVSGNFALYTSSSTEPCKTTLTTEKTYVPIVDYVLDEGSIGTTTIEDEEYASFIENAPFKANATGTDLYYIQLPENQYFTTNIWPKYMFIDSYGNPVTALKMAAKKEFTMEDGKSNLLKLWVYQSDSAFNEDQGYRIVVNFGYYTEKFILTSGVTRDKFGNVINVTKEDTYGKNTSDGVTSITMFHSRSKAYYQKHQMLFATTEEYMSKVMYGKSRYTDEYYADRIKVTHGTDGPRGILSDLLVIDSSSLYAMDELVINKDFSKEKYENEETFIYFPITAPYSPLSDGPNARYGLAIKKSEREPSFTDEKLLVEKVINYLKVIANNSWNPTETNIYPLDTTKIATDENGDTCSIYWKTVPNTSYELNETGAKIYYTDGYEPLKLVVTNTTELRGDLESANAVEPSTITVTTGSTDYDIAKNIAYIKASGITPASGKLIGYGIGNETDEVVTALKLGEGAQLKAVIYDGDLTAEEKFEYGIEGVPFTSEIVSFNASDEFAIKDAKPDQYLVLYEYTHEDAGTSNEKYVISRFGRYKLTQALLKYPCDITAIVNSGLGTIALDNGAFAQSFNKVVAYNTNVFLKLSPDTGYKISSVKQNIGGTETELYDAENYDSSTGIQITPTSSMTIEVTFVLD